MRVYYDRDCDINLIKDKKVAILPDQSLEDDDLIAFTKRMGPLFTHVRSMFHSPEHPEIMFVSNLKDDGRPLGSLGDVPMAVARGNLILADEGRTLDYGVTGPAPLRAASTDDNADFDAFLAFLEEWSENEDVTAFSETIVVPSNCPPLRIAW